jgi:hypothetical protein
MPIVSNGTTIERRGASFDTPPMAAAQDELDLCWLKNLWSQTGLR